MQPAPHSRHLARRLRLRECSLEHSLQRAGRARTDASGLAHRDHQLVDCHRRDIATGSSSRLAAERRAAARAADAARAASLAHAPPLLLRGRAAVIMRDVYPPRTVALYGVVVRAFLEARLLAAPPAHGLERELLDCTAHVAVPQLADATAVRRIGAGAPVGGNAHAQAEDRAAHLAPRWRVASSERARQAMVGHPILSSDAAELQRVEQHEFASVDVEQHRLASVICALAIVDSVIELDGALVKCSCRVSDDVAVPTPNCSPGASGRIDHCPHVPPALRVANKDQPLPAQQFCRTLWPDVAKATARRCIRPPNGASAPVAARERGEAF